MRTITPVACPMPIVHPTSILSPKVELAADVEIGPFCVIEGDVRLDTGVKLVGNVYIRGPVRIGARTLIHPFTCIGFAAQHLKIDQQRIAGAGVVIGAECVLREGVTVHAASTEEHPTRIGDRAFLMANAHVGHDAEVGAGATLVNNSALGGHSLVGEAATLGGGAMVHQFTRVGRLAFIGGATRVTADVPPFTSAVERSRLIGVNLVGLRRAGVERSEITTVRTAFRRAFRRPMGRAEMIAGLEPLAGASSLVREMTEFIRGGSRPISVGYDRADPPSDSSES